MLTKEIITSIFSEYGIKKTATLRIDDIEIINKRLPVPSKGGAVIFLIPYRFEYKIKDGRRMSRYARARDYHAFAASLFDAVIPRFKELEPTASFYGYCDNSPINEKKAAEKAGLGFCCKNTLLINKEYGSYVFIGEIITDAELEYYLGGEGVVPTQSEKCTICLNMCPNNALVAGMQIEKCLSALSQKKHKTDAEREILIKHKVVWGCDVCQDCCPYNIDTEQTPIEYFKTGVLDNCSLELLEKMDDEEFSQYAFAWRGKNVILENIQKI